MRNEGPSLVILDLNNPRTDPLGIVSAMHADPALSAIPTVGYVSHVDTDDNTIGKLFRGFHQKRRIAERGGSKHDAAHSK